jgi:DNA-binding NtrC family response regulator
MSASRALAAARVLVIDDEPSARFGIREFLESQSFAVEECATLDRGLAVMREQRLDAAVIDYRLPDGNALEALPKLRQIDPNVPIIVLTGYASIDLAVQAIKGGADQFMTKPLDLAALLGVIQGAIRDRHARGRRATDRIATDAAFDPFVGISPAIQSLQEPALTIAGATSTVVLYGETGSGKGVLAQWLRRTSDRSQQPFVELNCAALSAEFLATELFGHGKGAFTSAVQAKAGLLEIADRGTMFLDEIGDMNLTVQSMLLKVLEEKRFRRLGENVDRRVDVRLIAATHQDLARLVREGRFRSDLYFRIHALALSVPPLRDRIEDIPLLAEAILTRLCARSGPRVHLSAGALRTLGSHAWPGNIRELRNVLERALLFAGGEFIETHDIRFDTGGTSPAIVREMPVPAAATSPIVTASGTHLTLKEVEQRHIANVLAEENGHVERAARRLGIPRSSLYAKIRSGRVRRFKVHEGTGRSSTA